MKTTQFSDLLGKTLTNVEARIHCEEIVFTDSTGQQWKLYHEQDCCECVTVEDIAGDLDDLVGSPITQAEESSSGKSGQFGDSQTWTFYRIATAKGQVVIRWLGESNGYYSESVDFCRVESAQKPTEEAQGSGSLYLSTLPLDSKAQSKAPDINTNTPTP